MDSYPNCNPKTSKLNPYLKYVLPTICVFATVSAIERPVPINIAASQIHNSSFLWHPTPTSTFVNLPFSQVASKCIEILNTNKLLPSECTLPPHCGQQHWHQISSTWYGGEVGICVGLGVTPPIPYNHSAFHGFIDSRHQWARLYQIYLQADYAIDEPFVELDVDDDDNILDELVLAEHSNGIWYLFTKYQVSFSSIYNMDSQEISYGTRALHINDAQGLHICHMTPSPGPMTDPIYQGTYDEVLQHVPIMFNAVSLGTYPKLPTSTDEHTYNETHSILPNGSFLWHKINPTCSPYTETTAYSIPGFSYVKKLIAWTVELLISTATDLIASTFGDITQTISDLNTRYRIVETCVVVMLSAWHYPEFYRPAIITTLYLLFVGIKRP